MNERTPIGCVVFMAIGMTLVAGLLGNWSAREMFLCIVVVTVIYVLVDEIWLQGYRIWRGRK